MLSNIPRPAIIAHRGASHYAPENTMAAFSLAVEQGADAIELDVMFTRDREVVVIHDNSVDRTTNGRGRVSDLTLAEIKILDAGSHFNPAFSTERIPTLSEVLLSLAGTIPINIELKNYSSPWDDLPLRAASLVQNCGCEEQIMFSSFNPLALNKARKRLPNILTGFLVAKGMFNSPAINFLRWVTPHEAIHPHYADLTAEKVARAHKKNHLVNAYTVNDKKTMLALFNMGIDSIFTDDPILGLKTRAAWSISNQ